MKSRRVGPPTLLVSLWLCALALAALRGSALAVPANPRLMQAAQPDGTRISVALKGDEYNHWHEDAAGYTILKDTSDGAWVYAERDASGALRPGSHRVGAADPEKLDLKRHLLDEGRAKAASVRRSKAEAVRRARAESSPFRVFSAQSAAAGVSPAPSKTPILTGTMKNLVILARFSDQSSTYSQAQFNSLFNDTGYTGGTDPATTGAFGSVKDYYKEVSYNNLTVQSVVSPWVTLPHGYAYYGANDASGYDVLPKEMVIDAINALAAIPGGFDFSQCDGNGDGQVDGLTIIHSGRAEELDGNDTKYIWSHQWELDSPIVKNGVSMQVYHTEAEQRGWDGYSSTFGLARIGTICHETGHFLGLPDLYDTSPTPTSSGLGEFCLMSGGSWTGPDGDGASPAHMSAWPKKYLGWVTATQLTTVGTKSLNRIETDPSALYMLRDSAFPADEYFLIENRQGAGFDAYIPGSLRGLLIWHVDENMPDNTNPAHYLVDLEEASGVQHLTAGTGIYGDDSDYYRSGNNNFTDGSTPNSKSYYGSPNYSLKLPVTAISATGPTMTFSLGTTDPSAPTAPATVYDGLTTADITRTGSTSQLSGNWTPSSDPETGVAGYYYAIGTAAGNANVADWTSNALSQTITRTGLSLTNGTTYYIGVKAVNGVGVYSAEAWSDGQYVDLNSPADVPYVNDGTAAELDYVPSANALSANWGASASPGISKYFYAIGTTPGGTGFTAGWVDAGLTYAVTRSGAFLEGTTYYFSVKARNSFGYESSPVSSDGQLVDVTSPTARIEISSTLPARPGVFSAKLIVTEANSLVGGPQLHLVTSAGIPVPLTVSHLIYSTWTVSANLESYHSSGTATFSFSGTDPAGNKGTSLTGNTFAIDTAVSGVSGGTISNNDGMGVTVPAGAYAGNLFITVSTVPSSRVSAADSASPSSSKLYAYDLSREFKAVNSAGVPITVFAQPLTITLAYPDANSDGRIDGDLVRESLAWIYYLDETLGKWTPVEGAVRNAAANTISVQVPHFSVYSVRSAPGAEAGLDGLKAYPNPCDLRTANALVISGIPADAADARVYIYNEAAELVRTLSPGDGIDPLNAVTWDGRLKGGSRAATGLYVYLVKTSNYGKGKGKFFLVW